MRRDETNREIKRSFKDAADVPLRSQLIFRSSCRWVSVLQNSKEEALNTALGGDQLQFQDSGLQELVRAVISGLRNLPGNESCCDCGAPGLNKRY